MATIDQRINKLEEQTFKNAGSGKGRVEFDEEGRAARVYFTTASGAERPATAEELKDTQDGWNAMKEFMREHGFESVFDFIHDETLKAECLKSMAAARHPSMTEGA